MLAVQVQNQISYTRNQPDVQVQVTVTAPDPLGGPDRTDNRSVSLAGLNNVPAWGDADIIAAVKALYPKADSIEWALTWEEQRAAQELANAKQAEADAAARVAALATVA